MNAVNHPMWWTATEVVGRLAILIDPLRRVPSGNGDQGRLAERFGIHRSTVTAVLQRHGVELHQVGLSDEEVAEACRLYPDGWSLAGLAERTTSTT
jgi:hypothetical protein